MKLSNIKPNDCITVWYGNNMYMQSDARYILEESKNFKKGYYLTVMEHDKINKDIRIEEWLNKYKLHNK